MDPVIHYCTSLGLDPVADQSIDPTPVLQVFAHRYRTGDISPSKSQVQDRTVGDALRAIGQTMAGMGFTNPRLLPSGQ